MLGDTNFIVDDKIHISACPCNILYLFYANILVALSMIEFIIYM
jgi:hypothetical protein